MNSSYTSKSGDVIIGLLLHSVVDQMLEGLQVINRDWKYLYVNDTVSKQGNLSKDAMMGRTIMECYPGVEQTTLFLQLKKVMDTNVGIRMETEFRFPDQTQKWFQLSINPIAEGILIFSVDATEKRSAQIELQKKIDELDLMLDKNQNMNVDEIKKSVDSLKQLTRTLPPEEIKTVRM